MPFYVGFQCENVEYWDKILISLFGTKVEIKDIYVFFLIYEELHSF